MLTIADLKSEFSGFTSGRDQALLSEFISGASPVVLGNLDRVGLVLIAPECIALGAAQDVLLFLQTHGYMFLNVSVIDRMDEEQLSGCMPRWTPNNYRWWLIQRRFMMGPTIALLVCKVSDDGKSIHDSLARTKGYRVPRLSDPASLRYQLPAINSTLNLVHTSDSSASMLRESTHFYTISQVFAAVTLAVEAQSSESESKAFTLGVDEIGKKYLAGYYRGTERCESFARTFFHLQHRIIAGIRTTFGRSDTILDRFQVLAHQGVNHEERYNDRLGRLIAMKDIVSAQLELCPLLESLVEEGPLDVRDVREAQRTRGLVQCLRTLTGFHTTTEYDWLSFLPLLKAYGIHVRGWDELVILSTLYYVRQEFPQS